MDAERLAMIGTLVQQNQNLLRLQQAVYRRRKERKMSHGRRPILQLDDSTTASSTYVSSAVVEDEDDDSMGDMPTPERLVEQDLPMFGQQSNSTGQPRDIDNKVANFLAEIDALDHFDSDNSRSPQQLKPVEREEESPPYFSEQKQERDVSPHRTRPSAYSNMFVKGTPEFVKPKEEKKTEQDGKGHLEPWPDEPHTDWQQIMDEKTNYPYYWNTVTNEVVWDMPSEFSKYLILQKEYEEKVEKGLKEGTLDPKRRNENSQNKEKDKNEAHQKSQNSVPDMKAEPSSRTRKRRQSHSEDSSSDSSDSDSDRARKPKSDNTHEMPSSSTSKKKESEKEQSSSKEKRRDTPDLPDSTGTETKKVSPPKVPSVNDESTDFDIDDIDKELEMALERKRQELIKAEKEKKEKDSDKDRKKEKDKRRKDEDRREDRHKDRHRDDDRKKHSKHKDRDRDRDRDKEKERKHHKDTEEVKIPKLTLKERLRMEMELKLEKERKKKKALIEEMMAKELEKTVASSVSRTSKRGRDDLDHDEPRKRYRDDEDLHHHGNRDRDDFKDYKRGGGYDTWSRRGTYNDGYSDTVSIKPPPPTAEMIAYEEERRSEVVEYGHGRSRTYGQNDSDPEDNRPADIRDIEMKKLEALQLAELALSKLEFLEVSKKGLSKLQILLIELETRHQDWQAGGLTTNHFLTKLREANWQLEQYEASAAPTGWLCSWDRDYRRYFYTHKQTGKTQWDYPDADDIKTEDAKAKDGKGPNKSDLDMEISSTSDRLKEYNAEKDLAKEIIASVTLPPPPPPPAEEHPSVKSLQLMYGSSSESETEETDKKKKEKPDKEEKPPPPPPLPREEKHVEKEKKHKSKKKKKEKSKKKDQEQGPVGPVYQAPVSTVGSTGTEGYSDGIMTYVDPSQAAEMGYTDQQGLEAWYAAQTGSEVPVYGQVGVPESYTQNDQPLEFGTVSETGYQLPGVPGEEPLTMDQGHGESAEVSHPPETYKAVPTVYSDPNVAGDTEAQDGLNIEIGSSIPSSMEERKKKKKEKMGSSNISLKKKQVSSMVQKWQKVKKEVELEERDREIREAEIRRKLAELE